MSGRRGRLTTNDFSFESLRSTPVSTYQSELNLLTAGLFAAHLIEREYAVYIRINSNQELVIRIFSNDEKYELIIYPREDARDFVLDACNKLGGRNEMQKLIGLLHQVLAAQEVQTEAKKSDGIKTIRKDISEAHDKS